MLVTANMHERDVESGTTGYATRPGETAGVQKIRPQQKTVGEGRRWGYVPVSGHDGVALVELVRWEI